jgi:hypothetical protein
MIKFRPDAKTARIKASDGRPRADQSGRSGIGRLISNKSSNVGGVSVSACSPPRPADFEHAGEYKIMR